MRNRVPFTGAYLPTGFKVSRRGTLKRDRKFKKNVPHSGPVPIGYKLGRKARLQTDKRAAKTGLLSNQWGYGGLGSIRQRFSLLTGQTGYTRPHRFAPVAGLAIAGIAGAWIVKKIIV